MMFPHVQTETVARRMAKILHAIQHNTQRVTVAATIVHLDYANYLNHLTVGMTIKIHHIHNLIVVKATLIDMVTMTETKMMILKAMAMATRQNNHLYTTMMTVIAVALAVNHLELQCTIKARVDL